jgi:hypothetical protein
MPAAASYTGWQRRSFSAYKLIKNPFNCSKDHIILNSM